MVSRMMLLISVLLASGVGAESKFKKCRDDYVRVKTELEEVKAELERVNARLALYGAVSSTADPHDYGYHNGRTPP